MTAVLAVVGPTASGKTGLAIELAERLGTEIVSADSMQVYRGMEIGTGAPTPEQRARVPHHFVACVPPGEMFSAGEFERAARAVVARLNAQGKPAVAVGGSGLYLSALIDGLFEGPPKSDAIRERLHGEAETLGVPALYARLVAVDPDYADVIHANDLRRIVRALEVHEVTGRPLSALHREHRDNAQALDALQVALDFPREELYVRIDRRIDRMITAGLLDEVQALLDAGHAEHLEQVRSLGYREMAAHLRGDLALDEALALMKQNTRRYAKRQLTWFRADPRIRWLPATPPKTDAARAEEILALLREEE